MEFLKEGDIIELKKGHSIYTYLPEHFAYENRIGSWDLTYCEVTIGSNKKGLDTNFLEGKYIVVKTALQGGGTGHGPGDIYPDGHYVVCEKILPERNKGNIEVSFYQSGCFTCMIKDIEPIGKATCKWEIEK